jgi:predicted ATP-grasp superfamily ATP-dependent carboligase
MKQKANVSHPAVVCGLGPTGLAMVRSLGRRGVRVLGVESDPRQWGVSSRYLCDRIALNGSHGDAGLLEHLIALGRRLPEQAVLFPATDDYVTFISRHQEELQPFFLFPQPRVPLHEMVDKRTMNALVERYRLPAPKTHFPDKSDDVRRIAQEMDFPCVIKPIFSLSWRRKEMENVVGHHKVIKARSAEELEQQYERLAQGEPRLMIQELVCGEDSRMHEFSAYCNRQSDALGAFVGRKLRLHPPEFGSASLVTSVWEPELVERVAQFLRDIGYCGLCNIEFKRDVRDNQFKFIELNARYGLWDCLGIRCGMDLPWMAYCDLTGQPVAPQRDYRTGVKWLYFEKDIYAFLRCRRSGELTAPQWLISLRGEKQHALFAWDDPAPAARWLWTFGGQAVKKMVKG